MINILTNIPKLEVHRITDYLDNVIEPMLGRDVSSYAPGRARSWFPYEAPLSDSQSFKLGLDDNNLWSFSNEVCKLIGWEPELALVSKGGTINPHRDAAYADFKSVGINLGKVTWCYERIYPNFSWAPPASCINPSEITCLDMTGGEVFEFNCKNPHWTENVDPNRWAINLWRISKKKREEFNEFLALDKTTQEKISQPFNLQEALDMFFGE